MSTRSLITFKNEEGVIQIYKHWDGYPETTVEELQSFLKWNGHRNDDLSYTVANYCHWYKSRYAKLNEKDQHSYYMKKADTNDHAHTGIGIQPTPIMNSSQAYNEMNAEYFYIVDLDDNRIYEEVTSQFWDYTHKRSQKWAGVVSQDVLGSKPHGYIAGSDRLPRPDMVF